jgi:hypothetical protein
VGWNICMRVGWDCVSLCVCVCVCVSVCVCVLPSLCCWGQGGCKQSKLHRQALHLPYNTVLFMRNLCVCLCRKSFTSPCSPAITLCWRGELGGRASWTGGQQTHLLPSRTSVWSCASAATIHTFSRVPIQSASWPVFIALVYACVIFWSAFGFSGS